jgi:hypothetical protein
MRSLAFTTETDIYVLSRGNADSRPFQRDVRLRRRSRNISDAELWRYTEYVIVCEPRGKHEMFEGEAGGVCVVAMRGVRG